MQMAQAHINLQNKMSLQERNDQAVKEKTGNVTGTEGIRITRGEVVEAHHENEAIDVAAVKKRRKERRRGHVNQEGSIKKRILIAVEEDGIITAMEEGRQEVEVFLGVVTTVVRSTKIREVLEVALVTVRDGSRMMTIQIIILKRIMLAIVFPGEKKEAANSIENDNIVTKREVEGLMSIRHHPRNEGKVEEVVIISIVIEKIGDIRPIETVTRNVLQATERQRVEGNATVVDEVERTGSDMRTEMVRVKQPKIIYSRGTIAKVI